MTKFILVMLLCSNIFHIDLQINTHATNYVQILAKPFYDRKSDIPLRLYPLYRIHTIDSSNYSIEKIEMEDLLSGQIINTFLTLTYDYNLTVPLSLFNFDIENYDNYILIQ